MKKFMKAIAFATVMCMLLSVAAFADDLTITDAATVAVEVTGATPNAQIAFVVTTEDTAAEIATGNIKDVAQIGLDGVGAASITLGTGGAEEVYIFYGYQGVSEAQWFKAAKAAPGDTVVIKNLDIITEDEISEYIATNPDAEIAATDTDKATALVFEIDIDANGKTVTDMIWSIRYGTNQVAYADADTDIFQVLDGTVKYALAFSNGNRSEGDAAIAEVNVTDLHAIVKLSDNSVIFSDEEFDAPNGPQAEQN